MASKKVPLANNPNAANSPFRSGTTKRPRTHANDQNDHDASRSPPKKKQLLDVNDAGNRHAQNISYEDRESKVFGPRPEPSPSNAFQKKLVAAASREAKQKEQKSSVEKERQKEKPATQTDVETIRQWRRHYRKVFPTFVFYLESMPQDVCIRCSRHLTLLGAREEKFFSKSVTHVVTTRPIPPLTSETDSSGSQSSSRTAGAQAVAGQTRTINPSLLDKNSDQITKCLQQRAKTTSEQQGARRAQASWPPQVGSADVLHKAREMGIKIWPLEKFERMMRTIFDTDYADSDERQTLRKGGGSLKGQSQQDDLSKLLNNEKAVERPPWDSIIPFKGAYIYIHDFEEKSRPVMVRDYPKPSSKEDGDWPQFCSVPAPKCPFIPDESQAKKDQQAKEEKRALAEKNKAEQQPRTRAASAAIESQAGAEQRDARDKANALRETDHNVKTMPKPSAPASSKSKTFEPPELKRTDSLPPQFTSRFQLPGGPRPGAGREPMASGLQRSNQTSAIRSQMISSTAANPTAARAGVSKEMHQLQRRVVDHRHRSAHSVTSVPSSYLNDVRAAINNDPPEVSKRTLRRKPAEKLEKIHEDETQSEEEEQARAATKIAKAPKKKSAARREPKPGYCENCKDKYTDFNEHIESKKHRKFALAAENWTDLDDLLLELKRK